MSLQPQSSPTGVPEDRTLSSDSRASTTALGIPELLQIILLQVPVEYLTTLRRVARLWCNIISELNHLEPVSIGHGDATCACLGSAETCVDIPHYTGRFAIRGNPAFSYIHVYRTTTKDHNGEEIIPTTQRHYRGIRLMPWGDSSFELDKRANHFITDPPITLVTLGNMGYGFTNVKAVLKVPTGILVSDLRDVFGKMDHADDDGGGRLSAWFASTSDIVRSNSETGNSESDHGAGDDFAAEMLTLSFGI